MGKEIRGKPQTAALSPDPERSIGAYLARQRELRGISLDELATLTRIPRRSLERLESGVFDRAPDGFVRGFVRTVAAALGLDPDETVMRLLSEPASEGLEARGEPARWTSPVARLALLAVAGLLVAGALGWLATSLAPRRPAPRGEAVVLRPDPIRELAREAAARAPGAGGEAAEAEQAPPPEPAAEPAAPAAPEAAGAVPEPPPPANGETPAGVPPAAPDPAAVP